MRPVPDIMRALLAIAALGASSALADDNPVTVQDLEARGAVEIASGELIKEFTITCYRMPGATSCGGANVVYGEFRRLKLNDAEFVCVSFRGWACSQAR